MALLQILDPAGKKVAVGIDLGTTHSLVAKVSAEGKPYCLRDCDDRALLPSAVYLTEDSIDVGQVALEKVKQGKLNAFSSFKRFMGTSKRYELSHACVGVNHVTPIQLSAQILNALKKRAEAAFDAEVHAVVTVPAYFDDKQRSATEASAKMAGLNVLRLVPEPTAAALAYGFEETKNGTLLVYDLGGGTFDVTVLKLEDGLFQVLATGGDTQLGGDDADAWIASNHLKSSDATSLASARSIKHMLSTQGSVDGLSREAFEAGVMPLFERTWRIVEDTLRASGVQASKLDVVVLVGGSTRMPLVKRELQQRLGARIEDGIDPDLVVAHGASILAERLLANEEDRQSAHDFLLVDVLPISLGIETMGGLVEKVLPRNKPIPSKAMQYFTTHKDNQTGFELHIVQGERELAKDCKSLGRFALKGIPPMAAGLARLGVQFHINESGMLKVIAKEERTGIEQTIEVHDASRLNQDTLERMLEDAITHAEEDVRHRKLLEAKVEAEAIMNATLKAIREDEALLVKDEPQIIENAVQSLKVSLAGEEADAILRATETLNNVSRAFAERRMDVKFKAALSGQDVGQLYTETEHAKGVDKHVQEHEERRRG